MGARSSREFGQEDLDTLNSCIKKLKQQIKVLNKELKETLKELAQAFKEKEPVDIETSLSHSFVLKSELNMHKRVLALIKQLRVYGRSRLIEIIKESALVADDIPDVSQAANDLNKLIQIAYTQEYNRHVVSQSTARATPLEATRDLCKKAGIRDAQMKEYESVIEKSIVNLPINAPTHAPV